MDRDKLEIDFIFDWVIKKQENEKLKEEHKDDNKIVDVNIDKSNKPKTENMNIDTIMEKKKQIFII